MVMTQRQTNGLIEKVENTASYPNIYGHLIYNKVPQQHSKEKLSFQ